MELTNDFSFSCCGSKRIRSTPPKIDIEPENDGLVQMVFLFQGPSGFMLIFQGVGEKFLAGLIWKRVNAGNVIIYSYP